MKLHYNTWWLRPTWIGAITLGSHIFFKRKKADVPERMVRHELVHIAQIKREGCLRFYAKYLWYQLRYGYKKNPFEVEARNLSESPDWAQFKNSWIDSIEKWNS